VCGIHEMHAIHVCVVTACVAACYSVLQRAVMCCSVFLFFCTQTRVCFKHFIHLPYAQVSHHFIYFAHMLITNFAHIFHALCSRTHCNTHCNTHHNTHHANIVVLVQTSTHNHLFAQICEYVHYQKSPIFYQNHWNATHTKTMQYTATCCNMLQHTTTQVVMRDWGLIHTHTHIHTYTCTCLT